MGLDPRRARQRRCYANPLKISQSKTCHLHGLCVMNCVYKNVLMGVVYPGLEISKFSVYKVCVQGLQR